MSAPPVQVASNQNFGTVASLSATFTNPVGSGNCVIGVFSSDVSTGFTTATITDDKGNNLPILDNIVDSGNGQRALTFCLGNITNGPATVTVTPNVSTDINGMCIAEYAAIAALTNPTDGHVGQVVSSATPSSGNITTTVNGDTIVGLINGTGALGPLTVNAGTGYTVEVSSNITIVTAIEDKLQTTAGSVAADWSTTNTQWIAFVVALKPAGGGAAVATLGVGPGTIFVPGGRARGPSRGLSSIRAFADSIIPPAPLGDQIGRPQGFLFRPGAGVTWDIKRRQAFPPDASAGSGVGAASGIGAASGVGSALFAGIGSAAGTGAASAVGNAVFAGVGSASGVGAAAAVGASTAASPGSSAGTGAAAGVGASTAASVGASAGTGAASGIGSSLAASVGNATGTGAALGIAPGGAVASATGTGAAAAVGKALSSAVGSSAGVGTATATGLALGIGVGSTSGTGAAFGISVAAAIAVGTSAGTGNASGIGKAIFVGVGSASGVGTAQAVTNVTASVGSAPGLGNALGVSSFIAKVVTSQEPPKSRYDYGWVNGMPPGRTKFP